MSPGRKLIVVALLLGSLSVVAALRPHSAGGVWTYWRTGAELQAIQSLLDVTNRDFPRDKLRQRAIAGNVNEMRQALQAGFLGGNPPAAWQSDQGMELRNFVASGRVACIDDVWQQVDGDRIFPAGIQQVVTFNGRHYGIPLDMHTISNVFYNRRIFDELHLAPPATWQQFTEVSNTLRRAGYQVLANAAGPSWTLDEFYPFLLSFAGADGYYRLASGQMAFTSPEMKAALEAFTHFYVANYMQNWSGYGWTNAADQFVQGKVAMYQMGDWLAAYLKDKGMRPGLDYDFFPAPGMRGATIVQVDVIARSATSDARKAEAGTHFLMAAASADGQRAFNTKKGSVAANLSVDDRSYDFAGRKAYAELHESSRLGLVLPNLKNLFPLSLGEEFGVQIAAYAQNPGTEVMNAMLNVLEAQRQVLIRKGEFADWR